MRVGIKRVKGRFSNYANDNSKAGDSVEVMPPQGRFYTELNPANEKALHVSGGGQRHHTYSLHNQINSVGGAKQPGQPDLRQPPLQLGDVPGRAELHQRTAI